MASTINVSIKNLPEIKAAFNKAPQLMIRNLNTAIRSSIFTIGRQSRINTPVDTGILRASTYERFATLRGEVGTNTEYDLFVHEGTRFMGARPYLMNAAQSADSDIQRFMTEAVQNTLNEIGKQT